MTLVHTQNTARLSECDTRETLGWGRGGRGGLFIPCNCPLQVFWESQSPWFGQKMLLLLYHILLTCYSHTLLLLRWGLDTQEGGEWNFTDGQGRQEECSGLRSQPVPRSPRGHTCTHTHTHTRSPEGTHARTSTHIPPGSPQGEANTRTASGKPGEASDTGLFFVAVWFLQIV